VPENGLGFRFNEIKQLEGLKNDDWAEALFFEDGNLKPDKTKDESDC